MIRADRPRTPRRSAAGDRSDVRVVGGRSARSTDDVDVERRAGVHGRRPLHRARLDRVDGRVPSRRGVAAIRRDRRAARSSTSGIGARWSGWRRICTHVGVHDHGFNNVSTYGNLVAPGARTANRRDPWRVAFLRAGAEGQRRGAGRRWTRVPAAASFIRSTARIRCSSTPFDRCARWPCRIGSATG